ncbi:MAG: hypothetical protein JSU85_06325, partial [Candidatus Zixiibacteriota bacterium]
MNKFYKSLLISMLIVVFATGALMSAESIRVTSNIENESASFEIKRKSVDQTEIALDIPSVEITPVSLN